MQPHDIPIRHLAGPQPSEARAGLILLHGRGSNAEDMTGLARVLADDSVCVLAPDAPQGTWYPQRFLVPVTMNEPWLGHGLAAVAAAVEVLESAGVPAARICVGGFSQGACLAVEFAARQARRFGAVLVFAGALIGPDPSSGHYVGDLDGTPVLLASGDADQHVPAGHVRASARVLEAMGADVTLRIRPGMGHGIHPDDVRTATTLLAAITG